MATKFSDMTSSSRFFDFVSFLLSSLVTGPSLISISSLVLALWQFPFIRDWREIRKSQIPRSEFCPISENWGELGMPNLARTSLAKCYWKLQNARVTAFTVAELIRENQQGEGGEGGQGATGLNSCHFLMTLKVVQHKEFFFFGKLWKLNWGFIYLDICILPWIEVLSTWIFAFYHRYWDKMQGKKAFQSS